jgi:DNA-binding response OmpR family regulator
VRVVVVDALTTEEDSVYALGEAAGDLLTRPFPLDKHVEHLERLLRGERVVPAADPAELRFPGLVMNVDEQRVRFATREGDELDAHLTSLQFRLLRYLADRADQVVARSELHAVLHAAPLRPRDRRIDAVVTRIRHKLAASPYRYVHSHRGLGYRFAAVRSG